MDQGQMKANVSSEGGGIDWPNLDRCRGLVEIAEGASAEGSPAMRIHDQDEIPRAFGARKRVEISNVHCWIAHYRRATEMV